MRLGLHTQHVSRPTLFKMFEMPPAKWKYPSDSRHVYIKWAWLLTE